MKITIKKRTTRQVLPIERVLTPGIACSIANPAEARQSMRVRTPRNLNDPTIGDLFSLQAGDARPSRANRAVILKVTSPAR